MDSIEQYFQEEYILEKNRIKEIEDLIKDVLKTLSFCDEHGWPYELDDSGDKKNVLLKDGYSYSTSSMILFVVSKFLNKIDEKSSIIPNIKWEYNKEFKKELDKVITTENYNKDIDYLISSCSKELEKETNYIVNSGTFGPNDPLTLSWLAEIIAKEDIKFGVAVKEKFIEIAINNIIKAFKDPHDEKSALELKPDKGGKSRRSSNHIFPLLRIIHLYKTLKNHQCFSENDTFKSNIKDINGYIHSKLFENLQNRIYQQISYSVLQNSLFDTAELVLSIEGLILIDDKRSVDENLLTKSFEILKNNQKNNLYWRPLKPFVTSPQGDILLPLSIEIANSLLRICKHLEIKKKYYFHDFFEIFENYTKWLLSNVSQCKIGDDEYRGWRSEHVQKQNVIHPWETSQVVTYLMNYKSMIQDHIAYKSLKKSGLSYDDKYIKEGQGINVSIWDKSWDVGFDFGFQNCYKDIQEKFINERTNNDGDPQFSMLLYGPPGTGKSSIAEQLADTLNWRFITITPSDFIKHGEADIEGRAKSIFKTLEEQKDCVILFDEIDRLILDRDSNYYFNQGDFYQFMTPSMLVKIKDLRTKERSIFIIATNYEERIDSAIKRSGRIDEKYLVNTLTHSQRIAKIKLFSGDKIKLKNIEKIAKETVLYTFTELKTLIKSGCKNNGTESTIVKELIKAIDSQEATIKLLNYKRRFQIEKEISGGIEKSIESSIFPYREFLGLLFLKLESQEVIDEEEEKLIKRVLNLPDFNLQKNFGNEYKISGELDKYFKKNQAYPK
ncbi:MAG: AAA family ATPase [Bacteroidales bacterium]|nr:MAG: AAA family ATPase [Bacteroidales bacterium]